MRMWNRKAITLLSVAAILLAFCACDRREPAVPYGSTIPLYEGTPIRTENVPARSAGLYLTPKPKEERNEVSVPKTTPEPRTTQSRSSYMIHVLDVGQADSIIITSADGRHAMLIDAGNSPDGGYIVRKLREYGIKSLEYVICTHPHEDHIGGMSTVLQNYRPDLLIFPMVEYDTAAYDRLLDAIDSLQIKIEEPKVGAVYTLGDSSFKIVAPKNKKYDDINDYSVGIRWNYGENSMLACGDATEISESDMLLTGDLNADIYKTNHHGSFGSNSIMYLAAVSPEYAVITCESGEALPHPRIEKRLSRSGAAVYRTDVNGEVTFVCSQSEIEVSTAR